MSIPILICVVYIASYGTNIKYVTSIWMSNTLAVLILSMPILVKRPVFLLHLWLPIAHVEAPSFGSVILASVTLKIGVYGVIRILIFWSYRLNNVIRINRSIGPVIFSICGNSNRSI